MLRLSLPFFGTVLHTFDSHSFSGFRQILPHAREEAGIDGIYFGF